MNALTSKATDAEIESVIKDWLRYAKDRAYGRKRPNTTDEIDTVV